MIHIISLGAGVQSSTMALMAAHGEIEPMPSCAIFADTQAEPKAVYAWLDLLETKLPFPVWRVTNGNLRDEIMAATSGLQRINARPPFFLSSGGMLRRQCTQDYKLIPIQRKQRELIGLAKGQRGPKQVVMQSWIGISLDEVTRMKPSRISYIEHRWPLIELGMDRSSCISWLGRHSYPVPPKSACTFCPYHDDRYWRNAKLHDPESFSDAVVVDAAIRNGVKDRNNGKALSVAEWFIHRSLKPLDEADFRNLEDLGQMNMFENECEGMCGV